jgi:DNA-binding NarL/FixJ family response regulator
VRIVTTVNTVLIVDDHEGYRSFLASMLESEDLTVCGVARDGESALDAVLAAMPDLVVLDVHLPGIDGFEVAQRISTYPRRPAVILISTRDAEDFGTRIATAPVLGFVPKHEMSVGRLQSLLDQHGAA